MRGGLAMTTYGLLTCAPMLALLCWAAATDLASRRIPNWLTFSVCLGGLLQATTTAATVGVAGSVQGLLLGFGLTFVFFACGAMCGGDVKLLAGVGAWLGPWGVLQVFAAEAVIGMVQAVIQAAAQKRLGAVLRNSAVVAGGLATGAGDAGLAALPDAADRDPSSAKSMLPYSVPVLLATIAVVTVRWVNS